MFKQFDRRRRNGKIARLPVALRDSVDKMLLAGATYREIVQFLRENDVELSRQAVCNYARQFLCTTQQLRMAQENYKLLLDEIQRLAGILPQQTVHILFNLGFIGRRRCAFGMGKRRRLPGYRLGHSR